METRNSNLIWFYEEELCSSDDNKESMISSSSMESPIVIEDTSSAKSKRPSSSETQSKLQNQSIYEPLDYTRDWSIDLKRNYGTYMRNMILFCSRSDRDGSTQVEK